MISNTELALSPICAHIGEGAIDWLVAWYFAKDRTEAVVLAKEMLRTLSLYWCLNRVCLTLEITILKFCLFCGA